MIPEEIRKELDKLSPEQKKMLAKLIMLRAAYLMAGGPVDKIDQEIRKIAPNIDVRKLFGEEGG